MMIDIPRVKHPAGFRGPDWVTVLRVALALPPEAPVTRRTFERAGCLRDWEWAVREREAGQVDGRRRDSPWLTFVRGQNAQTVGAALPAWCMCVGVVPVSAQEVLRRITAAPSRSLQYWQDVYHGLVQDPMYLRRQQQQPIAVLASPTASIERLEETLARRHLP